MAIGEGDIPDPIEQSEIVFRRIPVSTGWYDENSKKVLKAAFQPTKNDTTGLSVYRKKYMSVQEAGKGRPGKSYYVAELEVNDLINNGINIVPKPLPGDPGHAELPDLTYAKRKDDRVIEIEAILGQLSKNVQGPFATPEIP